MYLSERQSVRPLVTFLVLVNAKLLFGLLRIQSIGGYDGTGFQLASE